MKKLLLTLGATAAIVAPVASVVACGEAKGTTPGATPGNTGGNTPGNTPGQAGPQIGAQGGQTPGTPQGPLGAVKPITLTLPKSHVASDEAALMNFKVSDGTEDAHIDGFLGDVSHAPRNFRVYDNGLFQIKIEKRLIGANHFFKDEAAALTEAKAVVKGINIGPAIAHLPKGIQILYSDKAASLGGNNGVQIATNNNMGSANDVGLKNFASLISHEYGHHETMWDLQNLMNVDVSGMSKDPRQASFKDYMVQGLRDAGYTAIANICDKYNPSAPLDMHFENANPEDLPNAYGAIQTDRHQIFGSSQYPFNPAEITTRVLNILSYRTDLSAQDMYETGKNGKYGDGHLFEPDAAFISDATIRHFAKDSVFGEGKDNSRVAALVNFYMTKVFGKGQGSVQLIGDISSKNTILGLRLSSFAATQGLDSIEVVDSGSNATIASTKVSSYDSKFGFKDELISDHYATTFNDAVQSIDNLPLNLDLGAGSYKIVGKDASGNEVDLSNLKIQGVSQPDGSSVYTVNRLTHSGKYLTFSATA